jgi:hypothetical protein
VHCLVIFPTFHSLPKFLLYINDLAGIINGISKPMIFADDTNIIIINSNLTDFIEAINIIVEKISNWFQANLLILNFNKTYYCICISRQNLNLQLIYTLDIKSTPSVILILQIL